MYTGEIAIRTPLKLEICGFFSRELIVLKIFSRLRRDRIFLKIVFFSFSEFLIFEKSSRLHSNSNRIRSRLANLRRSEESGWEHPDKSSTNSLNSHTWHCTSRMWMHSQFPCIWARLKTSDRDHRLCEYTQPPPVRDNYAISTALRKLTVYPPNRFTMTKLAN